MSMKNDWPTAKINFPVVNQNPVVFFLCRAILWRTLYYLKCLTILYFSYVSSEWKPEESFLSQIIFRIQIKIKKEWSPLTLYVLNELVLFMLKLDFEKLVKVVIFLYEGLLM
jgi:hypothetical protein